MRLDKNRWIHAIRPVKKKKKLRTPLGL